jgi:hypothetical protein
MCSSHGEYSAVWSENRQRARKVHRCDHCYRAITPGTSYIRIGSLYDGHWDTLTIHAECDAVCDWIKKEICGAHGEKGDILVGELDEEIRSLEEYTAPTLEQDEADELRAMGVEFQEPDDGEDMPRPLPGCSYRAIAEWVWDIASGGYPKYERSAA